eukprot:648846-Amorphochlora_amoeboformis.AAC.1
MHALRSRRRGERGLSSCLRRLKELKQMCFPHSYSYRFLSTWTVGCVGLVGLGCFRCDGNMGGWREYMR